jgi:hypothetical protein
MQNEELNNNGLSVYVYRERVNGITRPCYTMDIELFLSFRAILGAIRPVMHGCHSNLCE